MTSNCMAVQHLPAYDTSKWAYVYLLSTPDGLFKIGHTKNPNARLNALKIQLPYELTPFHLFRCNQGSEHRVERLIHEKFRHCRMNGEWFRLSAEDQRWFDSDPLQLPLYAGHGCYTCLHCAMVAGAMVGLS